MIASKQNVFLLATEYHFLVALSIIDSYFPATNYENRFVFIGNRLKQIRKDSLPGNIQAWHETTIYARTNGYIKKWYVDIGSKVKTGDLLAVIESPEVDAQLQQAEADLNAAIAKG